MDCRLQGNLLPAFTTTSPNITNDNNSDAQIVSALVDSDENCLINPIVFQGENQLGNAMLTKINQQYILIPPNCKFINNSIDQFDRYCSNDWYDFIVMDPPWWNKYIRRVKKVKTSHGYPMIYQQDILNISLEEVIKPNSLVAIWCTNAPSHSQFIVDQLLPKWNLKLLSIWYWIKVGIHNFILLIFALIVTWY